MDPSPDVVYPEADVATATQNVFRFRNGVYCTAGASYVVIAPNADAFFCMTDLEANRKPAFNLHRDGWSPRSHPYRCPYPTCSGCDVPYVTRWLQDEAGGTTQTIARKWPSFHVERPDPPETLSDLSGTTRNLTWLPSQICNFTCVYCDYGHGKSFTHQRYPMSKDELDTEQWLGVWRNVLEHVDYAAVTISGGEPTLSAALSPVLELISERYLVNMTTNASQNLLRLSRQTRKRHTYQHPVLGEVVAGLDQVNLSLHPSSRSFDEAVFRGNALMLKHAGFDVRVNFVGYPSQLYLASDYRKWCDDNGIPFMLLEWGNGDRFGNAATYTSQEREFFNANVTHDHRVNALETPTARYDILMLNTSSRATRNEVVTFAGTVTNTSTADWLEQGAVGVRVGARLYPGRTGEEGWRMILARKLEGPTLDIRCALAGGRLRPTESSPFAFQIDCAGLAPGRYDLIIDMVDDGKFWFGQIGAMPITVTFQVV